MADPVLRCSGCGQANRVPALQSGKKAVCGKCKAPLGSATVSSHHPVTITDASFDATIQEDKPVVVDFWAAWCGPCRTIAPIIEVLAGERDDVTFAKLNVDENPGSASRYRISGIPTLVIFRKGKEMERIVGAVGRREIEQAIARVG